MTVLNWALPRKLGQHFLLHEPILKQLAAATCGQHCHRVIEIGPGRGAFTKVLLPLVDDLHVVEIDPDMVRHLENRFAGESKLHIHQGDVLQTDLTQWGSAVIAGNLPYYITSPIIEQFLNLDSNFMTGVFLVQLEVANRLLAKRMTRDFSYLTVKTQLVCSGELICRIDPKFFNPPPRVDSAAVRLTRRNQSEIPADLPDILAFASRCFAHKRKTIRNNLRPYYGVEVDRQPEGFMRAEQIGVEGLVAFYRRLSELAGRR